MLRPGNPKEKKRLMLAATSQKSFRKSHKQREPSQTNRDMKCKKEEIGEAEDPRQMQQLAEDVKKLERALIELKNKHQALSTQQSQLNRQLKVAKRGRRRKKCYEDMCERIHRLTVANAHQEHQISIAMASQPVQELLTRPGCQQPEQESCLSEF